MGGRHSQPEPFTGTQRRTMTLRWEVLISTCNRMLLDVLPWEPNVMYCHGDQMLRKGVIYNY